MRLPVSHTMNAVSIKSNAEYEKLRAIGWIVARALRTMAECVRAGMTTGELNEMRARVLAENGAVGATVRVWLPRRDLYQRQRRSHARDSRRARHPAGRLSQARSGGGEG